MADVWASSRAGGLQLPPPSLRTTTTLVHYEVCAFVCAGGGAEVGDAAAVSCVPLCVRVVVLKQVRERGCCEVCAFVCAGGGAEAGEGTRLL